MTQQRFKQLAILSGLVAFLPLLGVLTAELVVALLNCRVSETGSSNCILGSLDVGMTLAVLYTGGWLSLVTIPVLGLLALMCYLKYRALQSKAS
ncbi:hypothetical protein ACFOEE_06570 [Pseudoalteromonas fenneropenaei]|uniref:Uncharacterized protein n=1 Tax=Pseudoalteromonas fenneropenaei TaxID=1737459 RepID=A0ABV7CI11_9GAMM